MGGQLVLGAILALLGGAVVLSYVLPHRRRRPTRRPVRRAPAQIAATAPPPTARRSNEVVQRWRLVQQIRLARQRRSLQRVSADLRRLRALLVDDHHDSAVHQFAHRMAYDHLLVEACGMLAVPHGLEPELSGPDREIERFRTEANLQAAGVVLLPRIRQVLD